MTSLLTKVASVASFLRERILGFAFLTIRKKCFFFGTLRRTTHIRELLGLRIEANPRFLWLSRLFPQNESKFGETKHFSYCCIEGRRI
jgi:hypothetical protein